MAISAETVVKPKKSKKVKKSTTVSFDEEIVTKDVAQKILKRKKKHESRQEHKEKAHDEIAREADPQSATNDQSSPKSKKSRRKKKRKSTDDEITTTPAHSIDDSTTLDEDHNPSSEVTPKKKKRKKNVVVGEVAATTTATGKTEQSKRELKRLKKAKLYEDNKLKSDLCMQGKALNYLSKWKHSRDDWKFEKLRQVWLQQNMFDADKVPLQQHWGVLVEYLSQSKGKARDSILKRALEMIEKDDGEVDAAKLERARDIIQHLQE